VVFRYTVEGHKVKNESLDLFVSCFVVVLDCRLARLKLDLVLGLLVRSGSERYLSFSVMMIEVQQVPRSLPFIRCSGLPNCRTASAPILMPSDDLDSRGFLFP
jgi:hypothetical protein